MTTTPWAWNGPKTIGVVLICVGILGLIAAIGIVLLFSIPWFDGDTFELPNLISPIGLWALFNLAMSVSALFAANGMMRDRPWAKKLATVVAIPYLLTVPIGTITATYLLLALHWRPTGEQAHRANDLESFP